jgi:hypothetical protein
VHGFDISVEPTPVEVTPRDDGAMGDVKTGKGAAMCVDSARLSLIAESDMPQTLRFMQILWARSRASIDAYNSVTCEVASQ